MAVWEFTWTLWDHRNDVLHNSDVHDQLLDMDSIDLAIIEEWHAGGEELIPMDRMQCKGLDLETLLAKRGRFRRDWLSFVQTARIAILNQLEDHDVSEPACHIAGGNGARALAPPAFRCSASSASQDRSSLRCCVCKALILNKAGKMKNWVLTKILDGLSLCIDVKWKMKMV